MKTTCLQAFNVKKVNGETFIEGWANRAVIDRGKDLITAEAWSLDNYKKVPMILFNHDKDNPVGKAVDIRANDGGLWIKAKLSTSKDPGISRVRDLVEEGILNAFSVGFDAQDEEKDGDGINNIRQAELYEVSIVTLPMNQDSVFSISAKSLADVSKEEAIVKILKNKGCVLQEKIHLKMIELNKTRVDVVKEVFEQSGMPETNLNKILNGDMKPTDQVLVAFSKVLGLDVNDLKSIQKEEREMNVIAIMVSKEVAESIEAAAQMIADLGYDASNIQENENGYVVTYGDSTEGAEEMELGEGIIALVLRDDEEEPEEMNKDIAADVERFNQEVAAIESDAPVDWVGDEELWAKAKEASKEAFGGEIKYPFVMWWYMQNGGTKKSVDTKASISGGGDGNITAENPLIEQGKQTNVLLSVLIEEFRGLSSRLDGTAENKNVDEDDEEAAAAQKQQLVEYIKDLKTRIENLEA